MSDPRSIEYSLPWNSAGHTCGQFLADLSGMSPSAAKRTFCERIRSNRLCEHLVEMFSHAELVSVLHAGDGGWYRPGWYCVFEFLAVKSAAPGRLLVRPPGSLCEVALSSLPGDSESVQVGAAMMILSGACREMHGSFRELGDLPYFDKQFLENDFGTEVVIDCVGTYELYTSGCGDTILYRPGDGFFWYDWGACERKNIAKSAAGFIRYIVRELESRWVWDVNRMTWIYDPFEMSHDLQKEFD